MTIISDWWWLEHVLFFHILVSGITIRTDFHIFQRGWNHQGDIFAYILVYIYIATHVHNEIQRHTLPWHREDKVSAIQNLVARDMGVPHLCQKRLGIYWILEPRTFPIWALIHFPQYYIPTYQTGSIHWKGRPLSPQWGTCQQTTLGPISTGSDLQVRDHRK